MVKKMPVNAGDVGLIPGWGRSPGGGHGSSLQYSCLENPHGQRSLVGYSPQDRGESGTMEVTYCARMHGGETTVFSVSVCLQCGRPGFNPWVGKISWRRKWQPTPVFLLGKSHGRRSLVGYSPWGRKESD